MQTTMTRAHTARLFGDERTVRIESESGQDAIFFRKKEGGLDYRLGREYLPKDVLPVAVLTIHGDRSTVIFLSGTAANDAEPLINLTELKNLIATVDEVLRCLPNDVEEARTWLSALCHDQVSREQVQDMHWRRALSLRKFVASKYGDHPQNGRLAFGRASQHDFEESSEIMDNGRSGFFWLRRQSA